MKNLPKNQLLAVLLLLILFDQVIKIWIKSNFILNTEKTLIPLILNFKYVENKGMAMGLKYGGNFGKVNLTCIRIISAIILGLIFNHILKYKSKYKLKFTILFFLSGLCGNLIDNIFFQSIFTKNLRFELSGLFFGNVVDYIFIPFLPFFVFNLADVYNTIGIFFMWKSKDEIYFEIFKITKSLRNENK